MTGEPCEHWRGLLALDTIGALSEPERRSLEAHLDRCAACRHERAELVAVAQVLPLVDPDHLEEHQMPVHLERTVLSRLAADAARERRSRRVRVGAVGAVGAVAAAVVVALGIVVATPVPAPGYAVALHGARGVSASVRLTSESWGTVVHLSEHGQPGGQISWVSMRTTSGTWWEAGTYTSVAGRTVSIDMACALPASKITGIWVFDAHGHTLLHGYT